MRRRPWYVAALLLAFAITGLLPAVGEEAPADSAPPRLVIDGRGWGHGVGMAQDGALSMGRQGASVQQILGQFYPGTALGQASGTVRVNVLEPESPSAILVLPQGGDVRSPASGQQFHGFPLAVDPGGSVRVWRDAQGFHAEPLAGARYAPGTASAITPASVWAVPSSGGLVDLPERARRYRGVMEVLGDPFRVVNQVGIEDYLRGMGEVRDPSWPTASLQAQAVAARTYALWYQGGHAELCDTQRCQVYLGQQAEYAAMDRAVADTAGVVLVHEGRLVQAVYSANAGGVAASPLEGFGTDQWAEPYLQPGPYPTNDPMPWTVEMPLAEAARRLGYSGALRSVRVSEAGPSGRALTVTLDGDAGSTTVTGIELEDRLGLRSNLVSLRVDGVSEAVALASAAPSEPVAARPLAPLGSVDVTLGGESFDGPGPLAGPTRRGPVVPRLPRDVPIGSHPAERLAWVALALLLLVVVGQAQAVVDRRVTLDDLDIAASAARRG